MRQNGAWTLNTHTLPYRGTSTGGGCTTVEDLFRFATALTGHKLLSALDSSSVVAVLRGSAS